LFYTVGVDTVVLSGSGSLPTGPYTIDVRANKTLVIGDSGITIPSGVIINAVAGKFMVGVNVPSVTNSGLLLLNDQDAVAAAGKISGTPPKKYLAKIPPNPTAITEDVVLPNLTIGGTDGVSKADFDAFVDPSGTYTVYIAGDLVVNGAELDLDTAGQVEVLGDLLAAGTVTLTDLSGLTLAGSLEAVESITVVGLDNFTGTLNTNNYTVTANLADAVPTALAAVDLAALNGAGKLLLPITVTDVDITAGNGSIEFAAGTPPVVLSTSDFGNTGKTTFGGAVEIASNPGIFAGPVEFADNLTLTAIDATFNETASFASGKGIALTAASSIIKLAGGGHGALALEGVGNIISNTNTTPGNIVSLTPAIDTSLIFTAGGITQASSASSAHTVGISGTGTLVLDGTYTVGAASQGTLSLSVDLSLGTGGELVLTGAGSTGAILAGSSSVLAGGAKITGGSGGWKAAGGTGTITIEPNKITSTDSATILTGNTSAAIVIDADSQLTVTGKIDISSNGAITLTGDSSTPASLLLEGHATNAGKLIVGSAVTNDVTVGTTDGDNFVLTDASNTTAKQAVVTDAADGGVTSGAAYIEVKAGTSDATSGIVLGSIAGGTANGVLIKAGGTSSADSSEIVSTWKVWVPNT
jgi:hypothetical protein